MKIVKSEKITLKFQNIEDQSYFWKPCDILIDYLHVVSYVPRTNFSVIWRRHHYQQRAAKFRPMLGTQGLWTGRDFYRATPPVIRRTAPFNYLLRIARKCRGPILIRILTGWFSVIVSVGNLTDGESQGGYFKALFGSNRLYTPLVLQSKRIGWKARSTLAVETLAMAALHGVDVWGNSRTVLPLYAWLIVIP
jgi:hypothetical protein